MAKNGFADDTPREYILPETAHLELIQLREHLRLLVQLTESVGGSRACRGISMVLLTPLMSSAARSPAEKARAPGTPVTSNRPAESEKKAELMLRFFLHAYV